VQRDSRSDGASTAISWDLVLASPRGYATLGKIGFEGRFDYAAIGTVANLSARLCAEAKAEQILISQRVLSAIEDLVETEPCGELLLKGLARPVPAYNVRRLKS
jgi:adenylate cyclase